MSAFRPVVRIPQGELQGIIEDSAIGGRFAAFKGIPYAKPPVGELRFQEPIPAEPWSSTLDASKFGPNCAQRNDMFNEIIGSDDCLYLNVYTQTHFNRPNSSLKPVIVWIHPGGWYQGSADDTLYGPDYMVIRDVVLVTINYRLGILGFLNLDNELATGNQGLKDQVLALKWVQSNIEYFGGDPKNVTIYGESAGGGCAQFLTMSPWANGLYHKIIATSIVALSPCAHLPHPQKIYAQEIAAVLGKDTDDPQELINFLRTIDAQKLAKVNMECAAKRVCIGLYLFVPSEDFKMKNPFFPVPFEISLRQGIQVPLMLGYTSHEGILYLGGLNDEILKLYDSDFNQLFSPGVLYSMQEKGLTPEDIREMYFNGKPITKETLFNFAHMLTDTEFVWGVHELAEIQASKSNTSTWLYKFTFDNGFSLIKSGWGKDIPGACHGDDVSYFFYPRIMKKFGKSLASLGAPTRLVIDRVTQMYTDFAKTGNPTPGASDVVNIVWKPVKSTENLECLNIGKELQMETVPNVNRYYIETSKRNARRSLNNK